MRFGLFGTGPWATDVQGPALAAHPHVELVGVWGRNPAKAAALAGALKVQPYDDVDALLSDVDAVAVALPPDVQASIALRAARAGRHLMLDKPVALSTEDADAILTEVSARGLASVVFFTGRFQPEVIEFIRDIDKTQWHGARAVYHASIFQTGSPFGASPWRRERGGLWDVGPHALAPVLPALGRVERVAAMTGPYDTTDVLMHHAGGAVSSMSLTLDAPPEAMAFKTVLYGSTGHVTVPSGSSAPLEAFGTAIDALLGQVGGAGPGHPCDVRLGREVVAILAAADNARTTGGVVRVPSAQDAA